MNAATVCSGSKDGSAITPEEAKKKAAYFAADEMFKSAQGKLKIIGIGSGSTVVFAVERIAQRVRELKLDVKCISTSFQAKQLIYQHGLTPTELETDSVIDYTIDGADEVDKDKFCIKGGGGCLTQEKIVASCSRKLLIVCDYTKVGQNLGEKWKNGVPIEVIPLAWVPVRNKIEQSFGGKAVLRMASKKAGPVVTDNGNFIIDWRFVSAENRNWHDVNRCIKMIPGVVETGLFLNMASNVYYCARDGSVLEL